MAIELGALTLAIRDIGGDATLGKLRAIDAQAKTTGAQIVGVGNTSKTALAGVTSLRGALGTAVGGAAFLGATAAIAGLGVALTDSARAYDELVQANRRLEATAKITGVALADLEAIARQGEQAFALSRATAADFATEITKLTSLAGRVDQSSNALKAFLDLGAARGMTATQTLVAVRQAILGIDEGTDKLFNKNPGALFREYAASIGTTAGKLTDMQKQQALLTAALRDGAKVGGEYERFLGTAAGKAEQLAVATEKVKQGLGEMFRGARDGVSTGGASLLTWIAQGISAFNRFDAAGEKFWANLMRRLRGQPAERPFVPFGPPNPATGRAPIVITAEQENASLERGNAILRQRIGILDEINALLGVMRKPDLITTPSKEPPGEFNRIDLPEHIRKQMEGGGLKIPQDVLDEAARKMDLERQFSDAVGNAIANGIINGFAVGLSQGGIAEGFAQMGAMILSQMGSLFIDIGVQAILAGKLMAGIMSFLWSNPLLAIGLGVGMVALGASLGGKRGNTGRGSSIGSGSLVGGDTTHIRIADRAGSVPSGRLSLPGGQGNMNQMPAPVTINTMLLNPNDPASQRLLAQAVRAGERRGL